MKTRVPETVTCVNCSHNIVIKLYEVDTTINSAQGHFHTIHNPAEPAYTVYCINCGHFMTNDPRHAAASAETRTKAPAAAKQATPGPQRTSQTGARKKAPQAAGPARASKHEPKTAASAVQPRQKPVSSRAKKSPMKTATKKPAAAKQPRPQRKKAK